MKRTNSATFRLSTIASALLLAGVTPCAFSQTAATEVGTVRIAGDGDALGNGLLIEEDGSKARSTVTRAAIEKERPTSNPFQLLNLLPGVNASSYDATGLFGGSLRVRGFNSDQMGFTINGAPVNDSGNFAVYPQEYSDVENLCEVFVTQGSADTDAPHVGASGGNVGLVSCGPNDVRGGKVSQSLGQLGFTRTFLRVDTGLVGTERPFKAFLSYSNSQVDKFKGPGKADRDHVDVGFDWKLSGDTRFTGNLLYNRAVNNNLMTLTKAQWARDPKADFSPTPPQHLAAGNENVTSSFRYDNVNGPAAYYGYALNPFENALLTTRLQTRVDDKLTVSAEPYFWYGFGTGGVQQTTLTESASNGAALGYGIGNINRNGALNDTVGVYRGSVTETHRPGVTLKANWDLGRHRILAGYWFERADHRQTQPATTVGNDGSIGDLWLRSNLVTLNNGATYQGRDYRTISTGQSVFVTDTIAFDDERLKVTPALRYTSIRRDFTNNPSFGSGLGAGYEVERSYGKLLPSLGLTYQVARPWQVYGNVTQNMRAPSNFTLSGWAGGVTYANGAVAGSTITPNDAVKAETSINVEGGARFSNDFVNAQVALFQVNFKDRIAQGYNPETAKYTDFNVGDSRVRGLELQAGTKPVNGWSFFGSATFTDAKILQDFATQKGAAAASLPTNGKLFPDTPRLMLAAAVQYTTGPYLASLTAKHVGKRYTTLVNDESLDAYTVFDLGLGYRFENTGWFRKPTLRINVSNLFDRNYLNANSGSGSNITATLDSSYRGGGTPSYYVGAPRFISMTLSSEF